MNSSGNQRISSGAEPFRAINPSTGEQIDPPFRSVTPQEVHSFAEAASSASSAFARSTGAQRGRLLRTIARNLEAKGEAIVQRANQETGLPLPRLQGELARTTGQLRMFAATVEEGSWVDARIDDAMPDRTPLPRPDLRSMLRPLGPVAVFGASNFPLAFSVAGGDTASALAAGNTVVVKAHPAHPGTSMLAAEAITAAVKECDLPEGVFEVFFESGIEAGAALVQHSAIKAVAFTGSTAGGQALMRLAAQRDEPIPCFAEMGSANPLFIFPGAMQQRPAELAKGLHASFTLGVGQFCTKPGIVFLPEESSEFMQALKAGVNGSAVHDMLTHSIATRYAQGLRTRAETGNAEWVAGQLSVARCAGASAAPAVFSVPLQNFVESPALEEEIFGPTTLLVHYGSTDELAAVAERLHGHLTATLHCAEEDMAAAADLIPVLESKVGRILFNGYPTGVEVCSSVVHGGPFPATSDPRFTSVGTRAMLRFCRPVCFQDCPEDLLPAELRSANPLGIHRMRNGAFGQA